MDPETVVYAHPTLNAPVTAIGGHYVLTSEALLPVNGVDILVFFGHAVFDSTCCGVGGCSYALVPGIVGTYRHTRREDGTWVSRLSPITDAVLKETIRRTLFATRQVQQVRFL